MKVSDVMKILDAEVLAGHEKLGFDVTCACGADLMSDVMAYVKDNVMLLTGLVNPQVVRTAEMMDIKVLVFVRGKVPGESIIELANEKNMIVLTTRNPMFVACGKLYNAGLTGGGVWCERQ